MCGGHGRGVMLVVGLLLAPRLLAAQDDASKLIGAWKISEVDALDGSVNRTPQPGVFLFTKRHYSVTAVTSASPRPELPATGASDKQRADAFGPFDASAGRYEVSGNKILHYRMATKSPNAMRVEEPSITIFRFEGDTLVLTEERGKTPTWKLTRLE